MLRRYSHLPYAALMSALESSACLALQSLTGALRQWKTLGWVGLASCVPRGEGREGIPQSTLRFS